jgi:hypothetical protein
MTSKVTTVLVVVVAALGVACYDATPYQGPGPVDDSSPGDGDGDTDTDVDADADSPTGVAAGEPCFLDGVEEYGPGEYAIQIRNRECASAVCLHYNLFTFCTHRCAADRDCVDVAGGTCEFDLAIGDPEIIGQYCVVPAASREE